LFGESQIENFNRSTERPFSRYTLPQSHNAAWNDLSAQRCDGRACPFDDLKTKFVNGHQPMGDAQTSARLVAS
jgi:hypothetical protein